MASLDKTSVRDEVSYLKADFDRLGSEGKLSSESQAIMNMLHMILIFSASRQGQYYNFFA
jgi:transposase